MFTLTIAGDLRTANSVRYFALKGMPRVGGWSDDLRDRHLNRYEITSAHHAIRELEGRKVDRIVIGRDYLRWHTPPGYLTELWHLIQRHKAQGTLVTFK